MIRSDMVARVLVEAADTLVDEFDAIDFLHLVVSRSVELLDAVAGGMMLADSDGRLRFVAASSEQAKLLELFQLQNHEGPCLDCYRLGEPVVNVDLSTAGARWPRFAPRATAAGFRSVEAFPMRLRAEVIGALNIFGTEPGGLGDDETALMQALADIATIGLLQERAIRRREVLAEQLQGALNSRIVIEQAKGAIAARRSIGTDQAFELLRGYARSHHRRLHDVARAVLTDPGSVSDLAE
ncbi:MAG: GAF and ANTAR domain-containing protein [Actinomycetes bacterium]